MKLSKDIKIEDFLSNYWYREELAQFSKQLALASNLSKLELKKQIEDMINNDFDKSKIEIIKKTLKNNKAQTLPKSAEDKIPDNYSSSELYRSYFKKLIGEHFHFTAYMISYVKKHPNITFREYANEWIAENDRRKSKDYKPEIMKSTQYNQYIRDFFKANPKRNFKDAVKCWNYRRDTPGDKKYSSEDLKILKS